MRWKWIKQGKTRFIENFIKCKILNTKINLYILGAYEVSKIIMCNQTKLNVQCDVPHNLQIDCKNDLQIIGHHKLKEVQGVRI